MVLEALEERCLLSYSITDLGTLGGTNSSAYGINSSGQVVGWSEVAGNPTTHAVFWDSDGSMTDLGALGGFESAAYGINDAGQVVGRSKTADNDAIHAVFWDSAGTITDLGTLGGGRNSSASGINNAGQVVGGSNPFGNAAEHAVLWHSDGTITDLGTLGGSESVAWGINSAGQVVGRSQTTGNAAIHAVLWDSDGTITDLGTLGGSGSVAYGINSSGQVVGFANTAGNAAVHAFLWDSTNGMQDLGAFESRSPLGIALGINSSGQVVGWSHVGYTAEHAFLWDSTNGLQDLNDLVPPDSGWNLCEATAINDAGQIVGIGSPGGREHAFLLTPDGGQAPRRPTKFSPVAAPAFPQVLASFVSQDTPGVSGSGALFQNGQASPVPRQPVRPFQEESMPLPPTGLVPLPASTARQAKDTLFAAAQRTPERLEPLAWWNAWELNGLALDLGQPR